MIDAYALTLREIRRVLLRDLPNSTSIQRCDFGESLVPFALAKWRRRPWTRPPWQIGRRQAGPQPYKERLGTCKGVMKKRYQEDPELNWFNCKQSMRLRELDKRKMKGVK